MLYQLQDVDVCILHGLLRETLQFSKNKTLSSEKGVVLLRAVLCLSYSKDIISNDMKIITELLLTYNNRLKKNEKWEEGKPITIAHLLAAYCEMLNDQHYLH